MQYIDDNNLTHNQQRLKWCIYCEIEMVEDNDINAVLKSLLADLDRK